MVLVVIAVAGCAEGFDEHSEATAPTPGVAARVNGAVIPRDELDANMARGGTRAQVLDELIAIELAVQAARAAHLTVNPAEVDYALGEIKRQNHLADDAALANLLAQQHYTLARYRVSLERELLKLHAINALVAPSVAANPDPQARRAELDAKAAAWIAQLRANAVVEIAVDSKVTAR
jgi:peptidyl-prolyl cis-trans isomerase SurA